MEKNKLPKNSKRVEDILLPAELAFADQILAELTQLFKEHDKALGEKTNKNRLPKIPFISSLIIAPAIFLLLVFGVSTQIEGPLDVIIRLMAGFSGGFIVIISSLILESTLNKKRSHKDVDAKRSSEEAYDEFREYFNYALSVVTDLNSRIQDRGVQGKVALGCPETTYKLFYLG